MTNVNLATTVFENLRLSIYHVERTSYHKLRAEIEHPHWAISHVRAGAVQTLAGGKKFHAPQGTVMIHPPSLPYAEYSEQPGTHEWLIFEARSQLDVDFFQLHPLPRTIALAAPQDFSQIFGELLAAWNSRAADVHRGLQVFTHTTRLLALLLENWQRAGAPARAVDDQGASGRFLDVVHYMSKNLHRRITRSELAARVHFQPNYFDRIFRSAYGVAPLQMLRQMRLQRAQHLLETTEQTVDAISAACGFEDASRLTRAFGQKFGQPPGKYRQGVKSARNRYRQL